MASMIRNHMNKEAAKLASRYGMQLCYDSAETIARKLNVKTEIVLLARNIACGQQNAAYGAVKTNAIGSKS